LEPLRRRYDAQHYRLVKFYYECSNLRYLTSLITVPKLPQDPPNLLTEDDERPDLPRRPTKEVEREPTPQPRAAALDPEPINEFWKNEQRRQQDEYADEQRRLQEQREAQLYQQQLQAQQAQRDFEDQQRLQAEQQRLAQDQLMREQYQAQTQGRMAELERENLNARAQYERDQLMLEQYDRRMKALETELGQLNANFNQQTNSTDDQIRALQEQVNTWRTKYEALAKLYSQLRHEHLELLQKFKSVQLKAASAQEAVDRREKLEREIKTKNLELADMIRERDRALHDRDRLQGGNREELEKLKRELRFALEKADNAERSKGSEISSMLARYNREMADLEEALRNKSRALDDMHSRHQEGDSDVRRELHAKEEELEIFKAGMDQTLIELQDLKMVRCRVLEETRTDTQHRPTKRQIELSMVISIRCCLIMFERLTTLLVSSGIREERTLLTIIDSVLASGVQRVDDAMYELDSSMQAGNQNASPAYVLSQIEKAMSSAMEFSTAFHTFIADGPNSTHGQIIRTVHVFAGSIADVLSNTKGLSRLASDDKKADQLINGARQSAQATVQFFRSLHSFRLDGLSPEQKADVVIGSNTDVQFQLQNLSKLADTFAPKGGKLAATGDLGDLVDKELTNAANAIDAATERLTNLMKKPKNPSYSTYELQIHEYVPGFFRLETVLTILALSLKRPLPSQMP
jgi:archaellum component FlaC